MMYLDSLLIILESERKFEEMGSRWESMNVMMATLSMEMVAQVLAL